MWRAFWEGGGGRQRGWANPISLHTGTGKHICDFKRRPWDGWIIPEFSTKSIFNVLAIQIQCKCCLHKDPSKECSHFAQGDEWLVHTAKWPFCRVIACNAHTVRANLLLLFDWISDFHCSYDSENEVLFWSSLPFVCRLLGSSFLWP